jgi:ribosomal protein S18 acetylase RimI-like enzyme
MQIINSTRDDIDTIIGLYEAAVVYQKIKFHKHWQAFDLKLIEKEIDENRQLKIVVDDTIACIFAVSFKDAVIWGARDKDPSLYIHRIVTNPLFRGNYYVKNIVEWAIQYCHSNGKEFVRMDTWSDNEKLIGYYTNCGFKFIGLTDTLI